MPTFIELSKHFKKAFALKEDGRSLAFMHHDGGHIMTGCGIGLAEELRISALQYSLWDKGSLLAALAHQDSLYKQTIDWYKKTGPMNVAENGLDEKEFQKVQARSVKLSKQEVDAFYGLGLEIQRAFVTLSGGRYRALSAEEISHLNFAQFDFTAQSQEIKNTYESDANRAVAEKSANILHYAALRKGIGKHDIPAAGSPWHGPLMKSYR